MKLSCSNEVVRKQEHVCVLHEVHCLTIKFAEIDQGINPTFLADLSMSGTKAHQHDELS